MVSDNRRKVSTRFGGVYYEFDARAAVYRITNEAGDEIGLVRRQDRRYFRQGSRTKYDRLGDAARAAAEWRSQ